MQNEGFERNMKIKINKIDVPNHMQKHDIIDDLENIIKNKDECKTMQQVLGIEMVFRGFIVTDWFRADANCKDYEELNKKIVELCM